MRPFEVLTLAFAGLSILPFLIPARYYPRYLRWLPLSAVLALLFHLIWEGDRWQMFPAYALVAVLALLMLRALRRPAPFVGGPALRITGGLLAALWLAFAAVLPYALPVPQPKPPTGPYAIGARSYYLVDENRPEIFSEQVSHRELMVQIWYPAQVGEADARAPFIERVDVAGPALARRLDLPAFLLGHLDLVRTSAYVDAQPLEEEPFPLLVFSHGLRGIRAQNTSLMQELSSYGYVVAAIDHPYANAITIFPDGRVVFYDQEAVMPPGVSVAEAGARLVAVWSEDIAFVVQQLVAWTATAGHELAGQIDATRLGIMGHSTGGGAAIQACATIAECVAALALDGWIEPVVGDVRDAPYEPALMFISAPEWLGTDNRALGERFYAQRQGDGYLLTVAGTVHFDYTDIPLMSPFTGLMGLSGEIEGTRMIAMINDYALAFFDEALKDSPSPLLRGTGDAYPEVSFAP